MIPPKRREPVSPINTFAGCKLKTKNAKFVPHTILPNNTTSFTLYFIPITVRQAITMVVTLVANPSIPSVKLTAFVVPSITKITKGI